MASSSSSSHLIPASISQSWNHDVFLSFRGEDTRKSFVDHLYAALVQQGIHTYKDDETLTRGESISPALLKAIQESRIAVVVFSKNYADSSWCLDELAHIIECMDKRGQIVMPIFYHVDPSNMRKLKRKYEEAFDKHERENKHKVESWRRALYTAGNLSGWVINDIQNSREAKCIKVIVDTIFGRLPLITNVKKDLIGIETRLQDLKSKLEIVSGGVRMVGIWGVGGGGKTTLASTVYTEISHHFEARCLLENIREESSRHGLRELQKKFLSHVLKKRKVCVESEIEGRSMIERGLHDKKVLVVLDDVDDRKQLEALAGSHKWFGEGSRVIITTRNEHLLTSHVDMIYEVSLLSHDESIKLFSKHAFGKDKRIEDYETLTEDVVSYASGLPLALEVLGSFLHDKGKDEWKCALAKLKDIPDDKVTKRLKISYDGLEPYQQKLFLDIACFLRRWSIDQAMRVLDACSFYPGIGVKVLTQKSLIKVSNGKFDMHDLVEEMAHYIVRGEHPNHPEKHTRIWQEKDIIELCAMGAETLMENNHTEVLALPSYISHPSLPRVGAIKDDTFHFYKLIKYPLPGYVSHPRLPDVVANMKKLRWIYWEGYPTSSFPTIFQPTKLGCLISIRGQQTELWKGCKDLPNLKILDLRYSFRLTRTPDFNGLPYLERLILEDCIKLEEIHPSIGYHERLVFVNMSGCKNLETFPPIIRMKKLETLDLSFCSRLGMFPDIQSNMDSLKNLNLDHTGIGIIPSTVGQFCTNLVSCNLVECRKLERIEGNFRLLKSLKYLNLSGCNQLEKLAGDFFDKECGLEVLSLAIKSQESRSFMDRIGLQFFYQNISVSLKLPQFPCFLRKLNLSFCNLRDGDIPSDISDQLLNLQVLDLSGNDFSRLHSILARIPCLKFLDLTRCTKLVELPELPSSIAILTAAQCDSLENIGDLSNYKWLWKVSFWGSNKLTGGERVLHSVLQVTAVQDCFMSVELPREPSARSTFYDAKTSITLQLPHNWYSDFSGFLLCTDNGPLTSCIIVLKKEISMDPQPTGHWEEFDKNPEAYKYVRVGYVPFGSLRHTSWWNPTYTNISLEIRDAINPRVVLVPRNSKLDDSRERSMDCSEFWDKEREDMKTFEIKDDSKSSNIEIVWSH